MQALGCDVVAMRASSHNVKINLRKGPGKLSEKKFTTQFPKQSFWTIP
jgi:hypothetical protein